MPGVDRLNKGEPNTLSTVRAVSEELRFGVVFFPQNPPSEAQIICNCFILHCQPLLPEGTVQDIVLLKFHSTWYEAWEVITEVQLSLALSVFQLGI